MTFCFEKEDTGIIRFYYNDAFVFLQAGAL